MSVRSFYRPLYTSAQMREIDRIATEELGVPSLELMECAGRRTADLVHGLCLERGSRGEILVLCGAGNNAGDGLVAARLLHEKEWPVRVVVLAPEAKLKGDAVATLGHARAVGIEPVFEPETVDLPEPGGLVVDALLGTGAVGALRGPYARWARACRQAQFPVVSIDAPSGADLDTGRIEGEVFSACATVALAELKLGYFQFPARSHAGRIYPVDIGIPAQARERVGSDRYLITPDGVGRLLPERAPAGHKGTFGRTAIIGGSLGMSGAAVLASVAALRSGCGLVVLGVPGAINEICEGLATEVITQPLPDLKNKGVLALRGVGAGVRLAADSASCVLGCGAGRHHETQEFIARFIERNETPLVLDADGLYPFGRDPDRLVRHRAPLVITPHPGELARLLGAETSEVQGDRIGFALRAARHFDCVCILKGALTVVGTVTGQAYVNPTGNSGMGTAGAGDVLAGMVGSLIAQGMSVLGAATAGVYVHGQAGDQAAELRGERGMIASDILEEVPEALRRLEAAGPPAFF